ncbi:MAG: serine/threonine-protein kinase [Gemmataceae bacterium]
MSDPRADDSVVDQPTLLTGTLATVDAPPFVAPPTLATPRDGHYDLPVEGQRLGDFQLLRLLGSGAFGRVFLARQVSLGRAVALKVSRRQGEEARTLAGLEHDHIVRVFSETVDADRDLLLLCMQYVPGVTLEALIAALPPGDPPGCCGRAILDLIDAQVSTPTALDLAALRDREALAGMDRVEAGCWMGARLAEALAHAHAQGVLHRDIKPANILVNRYGRPMLVDFNIARSDAGGGNPFGGTLAYMAPEHLDAFNPSADTSPEAVDARSDLYSLGIVLYEFLTGRLPFPLDGSERVNAETLARLAAVRRAGPPPLPADLDAPPAVARVLAGCLAPDPADRYQTAAELAAELDSCLELRRVQRDLPCRHWLTAVLLRQPFLVGCLLMVLPHIPATIVNILYNLLRIVHPMRVVTGEGEFDVAFWRIVTVYNLFAWPICLVGLILVLRPIYRGWRLVTRRDSGEVAGAAAARTVEAAHRWALRFPVAGAALAALGWFPGGVLFPLLLHGGGAPLTWNLFGHFLFSFTISGLIALTYTILAAEYVVLRVFYPMLWLDARTLRATARRELAAEDGRLAVLTFLAVLIPLAGATLMIGVAPEAMPGPDYRTFRWLVTALLGLGTLGLGLTLWTTGQLRQTMAVLVGAGRTGATRCIE